MAACRIRTRMSTGAEIRDRILAAHLTVTVRRAAVGGVAECMIECTDRLPAGGSEKRKSTSVGECVFGLSADASIRSSGCRSELSGHVLGALTGDRRGVYGVEASRDTVGEPLPFKATQPAPEVHGPGGYSRRNPNEVGIPLRGCHRKRDGAKHDFAHRLSTEPQTPPRGEKGIRCENSRSPGTPGRSRLFAIDAWESVNFPRTRAASPCPQHNARAYRIGLRPLGADFRSLFRH